MRDLTQEKNNLLSDLEELNITLKGLTSEEDKEKALTDMKDLMYSMSQILREQEKIKAESQDSLKQMIDILDFSTYPSKLTTQATQTEIGFTKMDHLANSI